MCRFFGQQVVITPLGDWINSNAIKGPEQVCSFLWWDSGDDMLPFIFLLIPQQDHRKEDDRFDAEHFRMEPQQQDKQKTTVERINLYDDLVKPQHHNEDNRFDADKFRMEQQQQDKQKAAERINLYDDLVKQQGPILARIVWTGPLPRRGAPFGII